MHPRDDDSEGFEAFYAATAGRTFNAVRRMAAGDAHLAHDATQEAYLAMLGCWPMRQRLPQAENRKYLLGTAAHKVVDAYRQRGRCAELDDDAEVPIVDTGYEEILDELTILSAVRALIDRQPARRRAVAVLFFLDDLDAHEIAVALSITESTVRTHIQRVRSILKPHLDQLRRTDQGGDRP
ncbi:RNA polymerase sigma factor [Amycolatopsis sp. NPDC059021]|uniref:RNA polymerase sigma factor n=1 Tax=Amycolatopsis sp. NPDC059021 TaxID=3346704 RepID=UPI00367261C4